MSDFINTDAKTINTFEKMPISKALFSMALPTIMGQLIVLIYSIADTYFIGKTNNPSMVAAVSLILPIYNISIPFANLAGIGGGTLMARLIAIKKSDEAKRICSFCIYMCFILAAIYSIFLLFFQNQVLHFIGATTDTFDYAKTYMHYVLVIGAIPTVLSTAFTVLIRSCGFSKEAGFGVTLGGIINIILDPIFMFVILPKGDEVKGAAIATLLSNCIAFIYYIIVIYKIKNKSSINFSFKYGFPNKHTIIQMLGIGLPSCMNGLLWDVDYICFDKLMSNYGTSSLAALGIVLKAERLPLNVGVGIALGMMPIVAYNNANKNYIRMKETVKKALIWGIIVALISLVLYQLFASQIINFFIDDVETIQNGVLFLRIRNLTTIPIFLSFFFIYLFQSFGEVKYATIFTIMRWLVFNIPLMFIFNNLFGKMGLICSQFFGDTCLVIIIIFIYRKFSKKYN